MNEQAPIQPNNKTAELFDLISKDLIKSLNGALQEIEIFPEVVSKTLKAFHADGEDVKWLAEIMASMMDSELAIQDGDEWVRVYISNRMRKIRDLMNLVTLDIDNFSNTMIRVSNSMTKMAQAHPANIMFENMMEDNMDDQNNR